MGISLKKQQFLPIMPIKMFKKIKYKNAISSEGVRARQLKF